MLKVAIVGCGKIADAHASQIGRIEGCQIVGVCDREPLMALQLAKRFPVGRTFNNITQLLDEAKPDVVHITTPPQSHFELAKTCLSHRCHVYIEKPFTVCTSEAEELIAIAVAKGLKVTVGHDDQFSHVARRMRELVSTGFLGGSPVHMESYYCYALSRTGYAGAVLGDKQHWVRQLPGMLLQNIISHGIARIVEFIVGDVPEVIAYGFASPSLFGLGEREIIDELRVIIRDANGTTAYFTFSSQLRPVLHQFRIYGPRNGLILDQDQETLIKLSGAKKKSYLEAFVAPLALAQQYTRNVLKNVSCFLARDFHMKSGMKHLIELFYRSIIADQPVPIPYREIILATAIMDSIFAQLPPSPESCEMPRRESVHTLC